MTKKRLKKDYMKICVRHPEDSALASVGEAAHDSPTGRRLKRSGRRAATSAGLCAVPRQKHSCSTPSLPDKLHGAAPGLSSFSPGTAFFLAISQKSRFLKKKINKKKHPCLCTIMEVLESTGERSRKLSGRPGRLQFKTSKLIFVFLLYWFQILQ